MFDIDRELKQLHTQKRSVEAELRRKVLHTAFEMKSSDKKSKKAVRRFSFAAVCSAALVLAALIVFAVLPITPAAYYTIDINPSISMAVDKADTVLFATAENSDAKELLGGLSLTGLFIEDALRAIVQQASASGYLKMDGNVLVGHFGESSGLSQQRASAVVSDVAGDTVMVLVLKSTKNDFENAQKQHRKPGVSLLEREAAVLDVQGHTQKELIDAVRGKKAGVQSRKNGGDNDAKKGATENADKQSNNANQSDAAEAKKTGSPQIPDKNASEDTRQSAASQAKDNKNDNAKQATTGQGQEEENNNNRNEKENANSNSGNSGQDNGNANKGKPDVPDRN